MLDSFDAAAVQGVPSEGKERVADLVRRSEEGVKKYGRPLETFNGRNGLVDAYQEVLDLALYLRQCIAEQIAPALDKINDLLQLHESVEIHYYVDHVAAEFYTTDGDKLICVGIGETVRDALGDLDRKLAGFKDLDTIRLAPNIEYSYLGEGK